jgi:hypothetical protein
MKYIKNSPTIPMIEEYFYDIFSPETTIVMKKRPTRVMEIETIHPSNPYCSLFPSEKMIVSPVF